MSIRTAIYDLLNDSEADVYPMVAPQETSDAYVVYNMGITPDRTQDGVGTKFISLALNIYAKSYDDCIALAATMYAGLEGAAGTYSAEALMACNWVNDGFGDYIQDLDKYVIPQEYQLMFT